MSSYQPPQNTFYEEKETLQKKNIAIVQADFNRTFSDRLFNSCLKGLEEAGFPLENIQKFIVPGSLEIPAVVQQLQQSKKFDGIIALGIVIRGGTNHYEIVTEQSAHGLMLCSLSFPVPVINGILGGESDVQIEERIPKGKSFAQGLLKMMILKDAL